MKKSFFNKLILTGGIMLGVGSFMLNGEALATTYYPNDVTPPWGRITIVGASEVDNVNYVDRQDITVKVYASDDMCAEEEIKYYISTSEISDQTMIADNAWKSLASGDTTTVTLPSTSSMNTLYAIFKDKNGNTSLIYSGTQQTITYDANEGKYAPTGVATVRKYGAPFTITNQTPEREGYYFLGWSTDKNATDASCRPGDVIPADVTLAGDVLYAIWTTDLSKLSKLSDVVKIGDYVNYPVYYDNVPTAGTSDIASLNGWRVLSVSGDNVNLVSAGVPLTFYHASNSTNSIAALTTNFLNPTFTTGSTMGYRKNGFNPNQTFKEIFTNEYTKLDESNNPIVRSMTKEDLDKVYGSTTSSGPSLTSKKYNSLLAIPSSSKYAYYWLASPYSSSNNYLWSVSGYSGNVGNVSGNGFGVRPVVSLKSEVLANGKDMAGAWNIIISE